MISVDKNTPEVNTLPSLKQLRTILDHAVEEPHRCKRAARAHRLQRPYPQRAYGCASLSDGIAAVFAHTSAGTVRQPAALAHALGTVQGRAHTMHA